MLSAPRSRALVLGSTAVALGLSAAAAVGSPSIAGASTSAASLYQTAIANITKAGSVHYTTHASSQGLSQVVVGKAGTTSGSQTLVAKLGSHGTARAQLKLVGQTAYINANATFYTNSGITTKTPPAGTWISMGPSDKAYQAVASGVTVGTLGADIALTGRITYGATARIGGFKAVAVKGTTHQMLPSGTSANLPATMWIRTSGGMPVPLKVTINSSKFKGTFVFSRYGQPVNVEAPTTSTPASQYGG